MKSTHLNILITIFFINLIFFAQSALACSCSGIPTPYVAFKESERVFIGKIIGVTDSSGIEINKNEFVNPEDYWIRLREAKDVYYRFSVQESLKGSDVTELKIGYEIDRCQFGLGVGHTYLIYAYESNNALWTYSFCSRNELIENAQDEIFFLRGFVANKTEPRIYGSVWLEENEFISNTFRQKFLKGIKVIAESKKRRFETFTNKEGAYFFTRIPNGEYKVYLDLPQKYKKARQSYEIVKLTKNSEPIYTMFGQRSSRAGFVDFEVHWNNEIKGKIFDAEGNQLDRANVYLIPLNQINNKTVFEKNKNAERLFGDKIYQKSGQTPGKYVLAVEIFAPFAAGKEKEVIYYPQEITSDKAELVDLSSVDKKVIDFKLPKGFVIREIEGTMFWEGGFPNKDGYVSLEKLENSNNPNNVVYDFQLVKDGKFRFQVFENAEYWLHAKAMQETAKPIKIKVGKSNIPIKITLPEK